MDHAVCRPVNRSVEASTAGKRPVPEELYRATHEDLREEEVDAKRGDECDDAFAGKSILARQEEAEVESEDGQFGEDETAVVADDAHH